MSDVATHAESLFEIYGGKVCDIYLGERSGITLYADHEMEQLTLIRGLVKKAAGKLLVVECTVTTNLETIKHDIAINGWLIVTICEYNKKVSLLKLMNGHEQVAKKR